MLLGVFPDREGGELRWVEWSGANESLHKVPLENASFERAILDPEAVARFLIGRCFAIKYIAGAEDAQVDLPKNMPWSSMMKDLFPLAYETIDM